MNEESDEIFGAFRELGVGAQASIEAAVTASVEEVTPPADPSFSSMAGAGTGVFSGSEDVADISSVRAKPTTAVDKDSDDILGVFEGMEVVGSPSKKVAEEMAHVGDGASSADRRFLSMVGALLLLRILKRKLI